MDIPVKYCNYAAARKLNTLGDLLDSQSNVFVVKRSDGSHKLMTKNDLWGKGPRDLFENIAGAEIYEATLRYQPTWGKIFICAREDTDIARTNQDSLTAGHVSIANYDLVIETEGKSLSFMHKLADKISQMKEEDL